VEGWTDKVTSHAFAAAQQIASGLRRIPSAKRAEELAEKADDLAKQLRLIAALVR
jgi:hypothetical protein